MIFTIVYADMEDDQCNTLDFQLGGAGIDAQIPGNRQWNIKVYIYMYISDLEIDLRNQTYSSYKNVYVSYFCFPDHPNRMQLRA